MRHRHTVFIADNTRDQWLEKVTEHFIQQGLPKAYLDDLKNALIDLWYFTLLRLASIEQHKIAVNESVLIDNAKLNKFIRLIFCLRFFSAFEIPIMPMMMLIGALQLFTYHHANDKRQVKDDFVPPHLLPHNFLWLIEQQFKNNSTAALTYLQNQIKEYREAVLDAKKTESFVASLVMCFFVGLANNTQNLFSSIVGMMYFAFYGAAQRYALSKINVCDVPHPMQIVIEDMKIAVEENKKSSKENTSILRAPSL